MFKKHIHSLFLIATLTFFYTITLAPGLSWANNGADGGDLITAAATNGVAHPSGYPLYLLLARAFQGLPVGTLAFRTNLLSAICAILAALALQAFLRRQQISANVALIGGLAFGLAPAVWSQAVISEVYSLQSLLIVLFLWGLLEENLAGGEWMRGLMFGLTLGNHLTTLLLLPLLLLRATPQTKLAHPIDLAKRGLGCALGLSIYLALWIRAINHPPVNWGNPVTIENFWWLVSGRLYATYPLGVSLADVELRLRAVSGLLLEQFTIVGVLLGIYGLFSAMSQRVLLASLWMFLCFVIFSVLYGSHDSQVYLIPAYLAFTIWVTYGIQDIPQKLAKLAITVIVLGLLIRAPFTLPTVDAAHAPQAEQFGALYISKAPQHAIIFASGDEAVFALWYFHFALGQRPDTVIIADALLPYRWYAENLAHTYPNLRLSTMGTSRYEIIAQNRGRPVCVVSSESLVFCNAIP